MSFPISSKWRLQACNDAHSCLHIHINGEISRHHKRRPIFSSISSLHTVLTSAKPAALPAAAAQGSSSSTAVDTDNAVILDTEQNQAISEKKSKTNSSKTSTKKKSPHRRGPAEHESLELLGWPEVCTQVASFCKTAMGAQQAVRGKLPLGTTLEESKLLMQQTKEAATLNLSFKKIYYLRRALDAAAAQHALHPLVLGAIATTLSAAKGIGEKVDEGGDSTRALQHLARGIRDFLPEVMPVIDDINKSIQISEGRVLDSASDLLASTRATRQENITALRRSADEWARTLHESGAAERPQVVVRRDRLCVPVRAGRQSDLPRGSVALATSASGSTVYMEPAPLVPLNNAEAQLGAVEKEEEDRILGELTAAVTAKEKKIKSILASVTALDIATARAKHAEWLGAVEPVLKPVQGENDIYGEGTEQINENSSDDSNTDDIARSTTITSSAETTMKANDTVETGLVHIAGVVHPLLMQPFLPPLPKPPLPEITLSIGPTDPGSGSLAGVNLVPELWNEIEAKAGPVPAVPQRKRRGNSTTDNSSTTDNTTTLDNGENGENSNGSISSSSSSLVENMSENSTSQGNSSLVPIDLIIPVGKKVVAVTGPNTGGKTASLKALGLVSLMAKAGMFIPISPEARYQLTQQRVENNGNPLSERNSPKSVSIAWFDKILADLGDGQSLQQSLSTFSGHVRRLRGILTETTPRSLVLLDEVGSGTDPGEGAALAAALLLRLSEGRAALTYATTHHAELKEVATTNPLFVNASVEFNIEKLKPTYKLLWGQSGDSNALAVASGLGFDLRVVQDAREVAVQLSAGATSAAARAVALRESLEVQAVSVKNAAAEATKRRKAAEKELKEAEELLKMQQEKHNAVFSSSSSKKKKGTNTTNKQDNKVAHADDDEEEEDTFLKIRKVVADARNGKITPEAAEKELKRIEKSLSSSSEAAMTLAGLKWGSGDEDGDGNNSGSDDDSIGADQFLRENGEEWIPKTGDYVKVLKMGGAIGQILNISGGNSGGGGAKFSVKVGALTMQLRQNDVARSFTPPPPMKASPGGRFSSANKLKANGGFKPDISSSVPASSGRSQLGVAIQTSRNTADVRGMNTDEAVAAVEVAVNSSPPGSVVFAVHGVGTGRVRSAVLDALKRHPSVVKFEEAEASNGGCTVAYLR